MLETRARRLAATVPRLVLLGLNLLLTGTALLATTAAAATAATADTAATAANAAIAATAVPATAPPGAARISVRSKEKRAAEQQRAELQQQLTVLKRAIDSTESARSKAAVALTRSETMISEANRSLHELDAEQARTRERLVALTQQLRQQRAALAQRQKQLATLLQQQYVAGGEDRVKLLLSGEDPARISRSLRYLGYVSQAQSRLIDTLRTELAAIEHNQQAVQEASADLDDIASEAQQQRAGLQKEQAAHAQLVAALGQQLSTQRAAAGRIERDDGRLGTLVEQLGKLIERQQQQELLKQQAAAAARERHQRELARQAERARHTARRRTLLAERSPPSATASGRIAAADAIDADEPPGTNGPRAADDKTPAAADQTPSKSVPVAMSPTGFERLRGHLPIPVKGDLSARFGSRRNDGPNWKGVFFRAAEGTQVHAVAAGRVVYAEWLRGFGNLIIVDHGGQYLTIYGNNQAVLKHAGDGVTAGEVIASTGNTGGNEQSGLYFEMRYQGRAIDPLGWVTSR